MQFELEKSLEILSRTPQVLRCLMQDISEKWMSNNEGENTWSPFDVLGHLIHGEKTDWIPRLKIILKYGESLPFEPFDRFAQFEQSRGKTTTELLEEFTRLRSENLRLLKNFKLDEKALEARGLHPEFGSVSVRQLLSAWTVHDLGHIVQISRVMAMQYKEAVGPWTKYLKVLST